MAQTATVEIQMPAMGESVTEGTVLEWHVSEGDQVSEGDTVVEVSTDKVDAEVPAPADGVITRILAQPDDEVKVGQALAELAPGENGAAPEASQSDGGAQTEQSIRDPAAPGGPAEEAAGRGSSEAAPATTDDSSVSAGETTSEGNLQVVMPEMGESVTEGTVLEWHVAEGDEIAEGDTIVEVSTDKVDAEVPAPATGIVAKLLVAVDEDVAVGAPLAEITTAASSPSAPGAAAPPSAEQPPSAGAAESKTDGAGLGQRGEAPGGSAKATPVARRIAAERGIDLGAVNGSGAGGKVTKEDVLAAADGKGPGAAPVAPAAGEEKPLRGPAAMLAKAMNESLGVPTATSFRTVPVDMLDAKRKALNSVLKDRGMKVSFTHLVAWAIVEAARRWPVMTRTYEERDGKPFVREGNPINLGIAVDV